MTTPITSAGTATATALAAYNPEASQPIEVDAPLGVSPTLRRLTGEAAAWAARVQRATPDTRDLPVISFDVNGTVFPTVHTPDGISASGVWRRKVLSEYPGTVSPFWSSIRDIHSHLAVDTKEARTVAVAALNGKPLPPKTGAEYSAFSRSLKADTCAVNIWQAGPGLFAIDFMYGAANRKRGVCSCTIEGTNMDIKEAYAPAGGFHRPIGTTVDLRRTDDGQVVIEVDNSASYSRALFLRVYVRWEIDISGNMSQCLAVIQPPVSSPAPAAGNVNLGAMVVGNKGYDVNRAIGSNFCNVTMPGSTCAKSPEGYAVVVAGSSEKSLLYKESKARIHVTNTQFTATGYTLIARIAVVGSDWAGEIDPKSGIALGIEVDGTRTDVAAYSFSMIPNKKQSYPAKRGDGLNMPVAGSTAINKYQISAEHIGVNTYKARHLSATDAEYVITVPFYSAAAEFDIVLEAGQYWLLNSAYIWAHGVEITAVPAKAADPADAAAQPPGSGVSPQPAQPAAQASSTLNNTMLSTTKLLSGVSKSDVATALPLPYSDRIIAEQYTLAPKNKTTLQPHRRFNSNDYVIAGRFSEYISSDWVLHDKPNGSGMTHDEYYKAIAAVGDKYLNSLMPLPGIGTFRVPDVRMPTGRDDLQLGVARLTFGIVDSDPRWYDGWFHDLPPGISQSMVFERIKRLASDKAKNKYQLHVKVYSGTNPPELLRWLEYDTNLGKTKTDIPNYVLGAVDIKTSFLNTYLTSPHFDGRYWINVELPVSPGDLVEYSLVNLLKEVPIPHPSGAGGAPYPPDEWGVVPAGKTYRLSAVNSAGVSFITKKIDVVPPPELPVVPVPVPVPDPEPEPDPIPPPTVLPPEPIVRQVKPWVDAWYTEVLDGPAGVEWEHPETAATDRLNNYIVPAAGTAIKLKLVDIPKHTQLEIGFELVLRGKWLGHGGSVAPHGIKVYNISGVSRTLAYDTSLATVQRDGSIDIQQSFPLQVRDSRLYVGTSGAEDVSTEWIDGYSATYIIKFDLKHSDDTLSLEIVADDNIGVDTQRTWGISRAYVDYVNLVAVDDSFNAGPPLLGFPTYEVMPGIVLGRRMLGPGYTSSLLFPNLTLPVALTTGTDGAVDAFRFPVYGNAADVARFWAHAEADYDTSPAKLFDRRTVRRTRGTPNVYPTELNPMRVLLSHAFAGNLLIATIPDMPADTPIGAFTEFRKHLPITCGLLFHSEIAVESAFDSQYYTAASSIDVFGVVDADSHTKMTAQPLMQVAVTTTPGVTLYGPDDVDYPGGMIELNLDFSTPDAGFSWWGNLDTEWVQVLRAYGIEDDQSTRRVLVIAWLLRETVLWFNAKNAQVRVAAVSGDAVIGTDSYAVTATVSGHALTSPYVFDIRWTVNTTTIVESAVETGNLG
jgi:hypothetical protein